MKSVKGSKTEQNLLKAFAGESQARNRYTYFAQKAREEGYVQIAEIFEETANQEREHAKRFFSYLEGGELEISASFPAGMVKSTMENLAAAAEGENMEHTTIYKEFAEVAQAEGFNDIAFLFKSISVAEAHHEKRYLKLMDNIKQNQVFRRDDKVLWSCINCGYIYEGPEAPKKCPACAFPQSWFEIMPANY